MKKRPIWQKFYFCSLVCVLSAVCVITIVYLTQFWIEKKTIANENIENVTYFADNEIKSKFESVRNLFGSMTVARNLKAAIESGDKSRDNTLQTLSTLYADNNSNNNNVLSIFFLDKNGEHYSVGETLGGLDKRFKIIETAKQSNSFNKNNYVWFHSKTEKGNNICVLYQKIIFLNDALAKEYLGEILVCVDTAKATDNYFKGIANDTGIIFLDEYGTIAASSVSECIGKKFNEAFVEDGNYMSDMLGIRYSLKRSQATIKSWECISFVNYDLLKSKTKNMVFLVICIAIMCCALMGFIAYKITYGIGKPIGELIDYIKVSDDGEVLFETDELLTVKNIFDNIQKKLNAETEIRIFKEEQLRLAQVKAFEEQVNPHFLYNTLQIIQMLSVMGQNDDVQRVITYLGKMLRYGLDSRSEICLGEEIENIETYFKILKYRYRDGFDYKLHIDESLYNLKTIKFLFQPFIENAFKHGFKDKIGLWELTIIAFEHNDELAVVIRDNGMGIKPDKLKALKLLLASSEGISSEHVGIRNVNERIKLYYGRKYGVDIFSSKDSTQIVIHIPKILNIESGETVDD